MNLKLSVQSNIEKKYLKSGHFMVVILQTCTKIAQMHEMLFGILALRRLAGKA